MPLLCALIRELLYTVCVTSQRCVLFIAHESPVTYIISQDGMSVLMAAAQRGHTEVVTQLIDAGVNIDLQSTKVYNTCTLCAVCSD